MIKFGHKCNIIQINSEQGNLMTSKLHEEILNAMNVIKSHAKSSMSDDNSYNKIAICFENKNKNIFGRAYSLSIEQDEQNYAEHILRLSLLHPTKDIQSSRPLAIGNVKQILEYLDNPESCNIVKNQLLAMSNTLKLK